jgi:hypothetical protein
MGLDSLVALISGLARLLAGNTLLSEVFRHQCGMTPIRSDNLFE